MVEACPVDWVVKRNPNQLEDGDGTWPSVNGWRVSAFQYRNHTQRTEGEARLIAAAPALLAACKWYDSILSYVKTLRDAGATDSHIVAYLDQLDPEHHDEPCLSSGLRSARSAIALAEGG